ncbi:thyrotropin-releasing hormone receptor-like [Dreissena polymorpha]|uniref:G-protein coupled receptors family 1 profile domain-containing protein n=1 Tax=Dreissena polymorpha TaxID=45954 RepID=A0A9D4BMF9_DREPO|nr:thyrotropin-releasing hormone receptor-like [Dreissena polymorpha]KAH3709261.1 hypothetical protein DPMN_068723 [Dreissena polymorpha]
MSNQTESDYYKQLTIYKAGVLIWKVVPPVFILLGTIGNCLSILVLTRRSIRVSTTALFLTVLACSDLLVLYSGLLRQWLIYLYNTDVRHISEAGCKIHTWLVYSSLDFSAWIIIILTLERVISSWLPHRAKTMCTNKTAVFILIAVCVFILVKNSHFLYGLVFEIANEKTNQVEQKCVAIDQNYSHFEYEVQPWIDMCVYCIVPFAIILIGNVSILFKVLQSQKKTKSTVAPSQSSRSRGQQQGIRHAKQSSTTAILFTLSIVFLVTTSPVSIYLIVETYWIQDADDAKLAKLDFWWAVVNMLMYSKNSVNFLLYCLSGTKFKKEFFRLINWKKSARLNNFNMQSNNSTRT